MLGRSRLSRELWVRSGRGPDDPVSNRGQPDQARRTWFRLLFESQLAAYSPSAEGQANLGWYYWTCKYNLYGRFQLSHLGSSTSCPLSLCLCVACQSCYREDGMGDRYLVLSPRGTGRVHPLRREQRFDFGLPDLRQRVRRFVIQLYGAEEGWISSRESRRDAVSFAGSRDWLVDYNSRVCCIVKERDSIEVVAALVYRWYLIPCVPPFNKVRVDSSRFSPAHFGARFVHGSFSPSATGSAQLRALCGCNSQRSQ